MAINLLLVAGYGALTGLTVWYLPRAVPGFDPALALGVGLGGFLLCALAHEVTVRLAREHRLIGQMGRLRQSYFQVEEELSWARREMRSLLDVLERGQPQTGETYDKAQVMAEIRLLKSIVAKLSTRRYEPPPEWRADERTASGELRATLAEDEAHEGGAHEGGAHEGWANGDPEEGVDPAIQLVARREDPQPEPEESDEQRTLEIVNEALRHDRIEVVLQPIVSLPQRKRRFYECFTRLRDAEGNILSAQSYIAVAERAGLITAIDNLLLFRCIQLIRRIQQRHEAVDFFCNISSHTLADEEFLGDFTDYLRTNSELARNLVFETAQADLHAQTPETLEQLEALRKLGCRFSLDRVEDLDLDPEALAARQISFVKLEGQALLALARLEGDDALESLLAGLDQAKIDVIVEKIELEETLRELLDYRIDFGQGYLFGEPRPAKIAA